MFSDEDPNPSEAPSIEAGRLLDQHFALVEQMSRYLELVRSTPGAITPEVVTFFENMLAAQEQWMASHGIVWRTGTAPAPLRMEADANGL
jgi:hypothetical protein